MQLSALPLLQAPASFPPSLLALGPPFFFLDPGSWALGPPSLLDPPPLLPHLSLGLSGYRSPWRKSRGLPPGRRGHADLP